MKNLKKLNRNDLRSISGGETGTGAQLNIVPLGQALGQLFGGLFGAGVGAAYNGAVCNVQCTINGVVTIKVLNCGSTC